MNRPRNVTKKQFNRLYWIRDYIAEYGVAPSLKEMSTEFGVHANAVIRSIDYLRDRGYVSLVPGGYSRTVVLTKRAFNYLPSFTYPTKE